MVFSKDYDGPDDHGPDDANERDTIEEQLADLAKSNNEGSFREVRRNRCLIDLGQSIKQKNMHAQGWVPAESRRRNC